MRKEKQHTKTDSPKQVKTIQHHSALLNPYTATPVMPAMLTTMPGHVEKEGRAAMTEARWD